MPSKSRTGSGGDRNIRTVQEVRDKEKVRVRRGKGAVWMTSKGDGHREA